MLSIRTANKPYQNSLCNLVFIYIDIVLFALKYPIEMCPLDLKCMLLLK